MGLDSRALIEGRNPAGHTPASTKVPPTPAPRALAPVPSLAEPAHVFNGLTTRQAKRRALSFWYAHQRELGLTVVAFFARCRLTQEAGLFRITFYQDRPKAA